MSHLKSLTQIEAAYYEKLKALVTKREQQLEVLKRFHEKVKHIETAYYEKLKALVTRREQQLEVLKRFHEKVKHIETVDAREYIKHPVNAFLAIKRLRQDWQYFQKVADTDHSEDMVTSLRHYISMFPTNEDIQGSHDAFLRIQETYSLPSRVLIEGIVEKGNTLSKLTADDAFLIGKRSHETASRPRAVIDWMRETLRLIADGRYEDKGMPGKRFKILDHLSWSEYLTKQYVDAHNHTLEMLKLNPNHTRVLANEEAFRKLSQTEQPSIEEKPKKEKFPTFTYMPPEDDLERFKKERVRAMELCRGETDPIPHKYDYKLVCWYKTDHPMLAIKPAKVERIYPDPEFLLFRGAVHDYEIDRIKQLANPILSRATVHNPKTGKIEFADYRVSKSAWLDEYDDPLVDIMSRRIESYTGLSMETAEKLQVANYGLGGHYDTHFDFGRQKNMKRPNGNRIATMLFYMSNVERGGATVFTNIGQAVFPSKGDAVFWYNLHRDGTGDFLTRHAACPVLIGEKWVSNRWIHERGQEFRRRCGLKPDKPDRVEH